MKKINMKQNIKTKQQVINSKVINSLKCSKTRIDLSFSGGIASHRERWTAYFIWIQRNGYISDLRYKTISTYFGINRKNVKCLNFKFRHVSVCKTFAHIYTCLLHCTKCLCRSDERIRSIHEQQARRDTSARHELLKLEGPPQVTHLLQ